MDLENIKKKYIDDAELSEVTGGLSVENRSTLSGKLEDMYKRGLMTVDEFLQIYELVWSGDDLKIEPWLRKKVTSATGEWTDLYLQYRNMN